eukprot:XP_020404461.1 uncharacterized protein LOC109944191 [Zea mays]
MVGNKKGKNKASQKDLKSYFSQGSSGSSLSTHGSGVVAIVEDVPLEENVLPSVEHDEEEEQVQEGITDFNPNHIISGPGLRIPIERFYANIRDEVRRAFIAKGPTQPTGHRFPPSSDKRSFQKKWFSQYSWLEYSVEKNKAYCFYCYLFKNDRMDDKFGYDAFTKAGFSQWKNAYLALPKHVGGPSSIHNVASTSFHDFDNQRSSIKHKVSSYSKDALIK